MFGRHLGTRPSDGRRNRPPQPLPNLGRAPFTQLQKATLDARARAVQSAPPFIHPDLSAFNAPTDSDSFNVTPFSGSLPYPLPGTSAVVVITYTVPRSKLAVIRKLSIIHYGGNAPDFTGQVIWRVLKNGGGLRGLNNLNAQFGTFAAPKDVTIRGWELDTIQVTVELPALLPNGAANVAMPAGSSTAASFDGFMYPLSEATMPQPGNF